MDCTTGAPQHVGSLVRLCKPVSFADHVKMPELAMSAFGTERAESQSTRSVVSVKRKFAVVLTTEKHCLHLGILNQRGTCQSGCKR